VSYSICRPKMVVDPDSVFSSIYAALYILENQMSVMLCIFNYHILRGLQSLGSIKPHDFRLRSANVNNMNAHCATTCCKEFVFQWHWELWSCFKDQSSTGLTVTCFIHCLACVQTLIFLLIC